MKTLNDKKYLVFSGAAVGILLLLVIAFNYVVDPYNLLGNNWTGVYFWNERQVKDAILTYKHEGILLGSSKTGYVNPDDLACYRFYNSSMRGMLPEEMYFYLKKYLRNEKLVLIGFDFYMFNEREFPLIRISDWDDIRYDRVEYLLGVETVKLSWKTLKMWFNNQKMHGMKNNGQFVYPGSDQIASFTDDERVLATKYNEIIRGLARSHYANFSFSRKRMDYVQAIRELMKKKGITCVVFINPLNQDVFDMLQQREAYPVFVVWKQEMKIIFPDLYDYSSSRFSARKWYYMDDPYHYTNDAGKSFLNEMIKDYCTGSSSQP